MLPRDNLSHHITLAMFTSNTALKWRMPRRHVHSD